MLSEAEARTRQMKEELEMLEGVKMIAPTILRENITPWVGWGEIEDLAIVPNSTG